MARFLAMDGAVGRVPEWYMLVRAAKYLGVAPWEMLDRPTYWMEWALMGEAAENEAEKIRSEHKKK